MLRFSQLYFVYRLVTRAAQDDPMVNIVAVNDPFIPTDYVSFD